MITILDELAAHAKERVTEANRIHPLSEIRAIAQSFRNDDRDPYDAKAFAFEKALKKGNSHKDPGEKEIAFICECKKASPSKGVISADFPYLKIATEYESAGADCISVLTEPKWFLGNDAYLREIAGKVRIPCLRKDFIVDEYMIYEARLLGASAVLLICALLSDSQLSEYLEICDDLGMSALTEAHDEEEISRALSAGARVIGVNNRNLMDFSVDTGNAARLRQMVPENVLFVAESGIRRAQDVALLKEADVDAVLIGEALMRAPDKRFLLQEFKNAGKGNTERRHR